MLEGAIGPCTSAFDTLKVAPNPIVVVNISTVVVDTVIAILAAESAAVHGQRCSGREMKGGMSFPAVLLGTGIV